MGSSVLAIFLFLAASLHIVSTSNDSATLKNHSERVEQAATGSERQETTAHKKYANAPAMLIDPAGQYKAVIHTNKGDFTIELFAETAPKTVNNFVFLAKDGYYDNVIFHRIIQSFMIQTGDPNGDGTGGPGYQFEDELSTKYAYEPGIVAMANAGPNTNGSQFFICTGDDSRNLNKYPNYTIFGKIISGMDTVQKIAETKVSASLKTQELSRPDEQIIITSIDIIENES